MNRHGAPTIVVSQLFEVPGDIVSVSTTFLICLKPLNRLKHCSFVSPVPLCLAEKAFHSPKCWALCCRLMGRSMWALRCAQSLPAWLNVTCMGRIEKTTNRCNAFLVSKAWKLLVHFQSYNSGAGSRASETLSSHFSALNLLTDASQHPIWSNMSICVGCCPLIYFLPFMIHGIFSPQAPWVHNCVIRGRLGREERHGVTGSREGVGG